MTLRYKPHQMLPPPAVGEILHSQNIHSLDDIIKAFKRRQPQELRSHRRMLLQTLRYMRTHAMEATDSEWGRFATELVQTPLSWDEAKDGRYRYRVAAKESLPPSALLPLLKSSLDNLPTGWHDSQQTRQHYRYVAKSLPKGFKQFEAQEGPMSFAQSMRSLVSEKFPAPHSFFVQTLANMQETTPQTMWTDTLNKQKTNDKLVQGAFALARHPGNTELAKSIHAAQWMPKRAPLPDVGVSLSFFEIIQRLPAKLGRPAWMQDAFVHVLSTEKDDRLIERGWKAVNLNEEERFSLLLGLASNYPNCRPDTPLGRILAYQWTSPVEERKDKALTVFPTFGRDEPVQRRVDNAKEWIALLVPELQPMLDICTNMRPGDAFMLFEHFLAPAETLALDLPTSFSDLTEVSNGVPK